MQGHNRKRAFVTARPDQKLQVQGIFYTVQGEGPLAGRPAVFIRLTGCNLRCHFCDTQWDDINDREMSVPAIIEAISAELREQSPRRAPKLVVLTGGEPTRQPIDELVENLLTRGTHVQIETAGSFWRDCMASAGVTTVVSPKTAKVNPRVAEWAAVWKYVIQAGSTSSFDGLPSLPIQRAPEPMDLADGVRVGGSPARPPRGIDPAKIYLSPCDVLDNPAATIRNAALVGKLAMEYGYTAGLQMHKSWGLD